MNLLINSTNQPNKMLIKVYHKKNIVFNNNKPTKIAKKQVCRKYVLCIYFKLDHMYVLFAV